MVYEYSILLERYKTVENQKTTEDANNMILLYERIDDLKRQDIQLNKQEAIQLELKFNFTSKMLECKIIGNKLFNFGSSPELKNHLLIIDSEQYIFLIELITKNSWKDCSDI